LLKTTLNAINQRFNSYLLQGLIGLGCDIHGAALILIMIVISDSELEKRKRNQPKLANQRSDSNGCILYN